MSKIEAIARLFADGKLSEIAPKFRDLLAEESKSPNDAVYEIYLNLHDQGNHELALQFILSFCNSFDDASRLMFDLGEKVFLSSNQDIGANLLMFYIKTGGDQISAYDHCLNYCKSKNLDDAALSLFNDYINRFDPTNLRPETRFNLAATFIGHRDFATAFDLLDTLLKENPDDPDALSNIQHLARRECYQPAVEYFHSRARKIAQRRYVGVESGNVAAPHTVIWTEGAQAKILASLKANGFCFIRNGCNRDAAERMLTQLVGLHESGSTFPVHFNETVSAEVAGLYAFDPAQIIEGFTWSRFVVDHAICVGRRVTPERHETFVPFHQDSTAFHKPLFNIWTPLTPAGGLYPSVQFVRKLVTDAEQTKLFQGAYNLVEIAEDYVMEKYGDLLFEVEDAQPGDCVMFYGTTIHRSCNLREATLPRYNIEVRWSPA